MRQLGFLAKRARAAALLLSMTLGIAGCTSRGGDVPYNPKSFGAPDAPVAAAIDRPLAVGDVVTIHVFKVDSLSGDQTIDAAGQVNLPLTGRIAVAGRTTGEVEQQLQKLLGERYLSSPKVSVSLKTAVQKTVTVDGAVQSPGLYPVSGPVSLVQVIALARGTTEDANPKRVVVFRKINGQRMAASFDLTTIRRGHDPDPAVFPDDVVVVDGSTTSKAFKTAIQSLPFISLFRPF